MTLIDRDLRVLWHPCTQMKDHETLPPIAIRRGHGAWLEDYAGKRYLDAISSWWVNLFGHAHPYINAAVRAQLDTLEHVILAGFTHEPAVRLAERLVALAPAGLTRCFYADSGSAAVEIALKMSHHYWRNRGRPQKRRFLHLRNSYHGETLGALAVGDLGLYKDIYAPLLVDGIAVTSPDAYACRDADARAAAAAAADDLARALERHAHETAALIIEPLVQCAGGMRMHHPLYLERARALCAQHEVHFIADEVAVGFGRTGTLFACEQARVTPDFLCVGKGLTGGYLPLSACITTEPVYSAFYDDYTSLKGFMHSHSFTGNALACAAALASLELFERDDVLARNRARAARMAEAAGPLRDHPHVADVRQTGMILAIEMVRDARTREPYDWRERRGRQVYRHALERGVLLRPLGDVIYFMPPYVVNEDDIALMAQVAAEGIEEAVKSK